jgi:6-phosphogluconolactonase (cycloisomerase 2 family)
MKKFWFGLAASLFGESTTAQNLFAASYAGSVYSLALDQANGSLELSTRSRSTECGISPSWLMHDSTNGVLYCLNEAIGASNGSITSFNTHGNGSLDAINTLTVPGGPVMSAIYTAPGVHDHDFFAIAH